MNKFNTLLTTTLFLSSLGAVNIATATEQTASPKESRQVIILTEKERSLVLLEMRGFLESVQTIVGSLAKEDWASITKAARKSGKAEQAALPPTLGKKLPKAFKMLGGKTHKAFDALALDSKDMEDKQQTLAQLSTLMKNCTSCHALFKFETKNLSQ
jgi:hypothetical protein